MKGLAYIGKITEIQPIQDADFIVSADVVCGDGGKWTGTIRKNELQVGDLVEVYLQDAIVPQHDSRFEFMEKSHWRVRMQRFRGVPSECLIMPLTLNTVNIGDDISDIIGVEKYVKELPANLSGLALGAFPTNLIPKTDELNFQTARHLVEALQGLHYYATVKMDGSSGTIYRKDNHFGCCSRNLELQRSDKTAVWRIAKMYNLENELPDGFAIQFEICGPGIQKNPLKLGSIDGFIFDVWDINNRHYLFGSSIFDFARYINMPAVDIEIWNETFDIDNDEQLRRMAEGEYILSGRTREGLVFRPMVERRVNGDRLSFKVINLSYKD